MYLAFVKTLYGCYSSVRFSQGVSHGCLRFAFDSLDPVLIRLFQLFEIFICWKKYKRILKSEVYLASFVELSSQFL